MLEEMDADVLAQRILLDLKNTFRKDPLIDEFDILPVHESVRNSCPVIHIRHKVALEDWCVKHVYVFCYSNFFAWKKKPTKIDSDTLLLWTMTILLINPEIHTVWNSRKDFLCQNIIQPEEELKFCDVVLSRKPKSSLAFAHRKWILLRLKKSELSTCSFQQIIDHEFSLCTRAANSYPNNYHAWCHRSWIVQELLHCCLKLAHHSHVKYFLIKFGTQQQKGLPTLVQCIYRFSGMHKRFLISFQLWKTVSEELTRMEDWVSCHVSDYSGFHYRQFLISCFHNPSVLYPSNCPLHRAVVENAEEIQCRFHNDKKKEILLFAKYIEEELNLLCGLQKIYQGHETLWNHRRYILYEINNINLADNTFSSDSKFLENLSVGDAVQCKRHKLENSIGSKIDWNIIKEEKFLKDSFQTATLAKFQWEITLIKRHVDWLQNVLSWPVSVSFS